MKVLAKQYGEHLVAVAYKVSPSDVAVLSNLIEAEGLVLESATSQYVPAEPTQIAQHRPLPEGALSKSFLPALDPVNYTAEQMALYVRIRALRYVAYCVNKKREVLHKSLVGQDVVYATKVEQANSVLSGATANVGYVDLESKSKGLSLSDAAISILNASENHNLLLFMTESVRMEFSKKAYGLETPADLTQFRSDVDEALVT